MFLLQLRTCAILAIATLTLIGGCSGGPHSDKPTGSLVVKVTYGGEPVKEGVVNLTSSKTGLGGGAELGTDGTARLYNIQVGEYVVTITPPSVTNDPNPDQSKYKNLPQKFRSDATSTLKATIKAGTGELQVELKE